MGYDVKDIYNPQLQEEAALKLTTDNANYLKNRLGINPTDADLYGAHFLGPAGYAHLYETSNEAPISSVMSSKAINDNPFVQGKTVGFVKNWLSKKMDVPAKYYGDSNSTQDPGIDYQNMTAEEKAYYDAYVAQYHGIKAATKEDQEADKAKQILLEKQKEQDFLYDLGNSSKQQQQEQQQQQAPEFDGSAYRITQQQMPTIQYSQLPETTFQDGGKKELNLAVRDNIPTFTNKKILPTQKPVKDNYQDDIMDFIGVNKFRESVDDEAYKRGVKGEHNGGLDALRHSSSAAKVASILPLGAGFVAANAMGALHEISPDSVWKETKSDLYNNFIGSAVGSIPFINDKQRQELLLEAQKRGILDIVNKTPKFQGGGEIEGRRYNPNKIQRAKIGYFAEGGIEISDEYGNYPNEQEQLPTEISDQNTGEIDPTKKGEPNYKEVPRGVVRDVISGIGNQRLILDIKKQTPKKTPIIDNTPLVPNKDFKFTRVDQKYREQPVTMVRDNIPSMGDFGLPENEYEEKKYVDNIMKIVEIEKKNSDKDKENLRLDLRKRATLEDTIENKEINLDLANYKTEADVKNLQKSLIKRGYNLNPEGKFLDNGIDGKLGPVTKNAMIQYNQHNSDSGYSSIKEGVGKLGQCTEEQCSEYMQNELYRNVQPSVSREEWNEKTGLHGNAWDIGKNIVKAGGAEVKVNQVKPGDVVTMFTGGRSSYQGEANAAGTGTTHTGLVDKVNPDGSYYILHNVHDKNYLTGNYTGVEYRDLVKDDMITSGGVTRSFQVRNAFRPDYKEVNIGEKKVVRKDLQLKINPNKAGLLASKGYQSTLSTAKEKLENSFIKPLNDTKNKDVFSKKFNLGDDEYNSLAKATLGILGQETSYGTNAYYTTGLKPTVATVLHAVGVKGDEVSKGAGRLKYETNFGNDDLTEIGVTKGNFNDEDKASLTTMYKLANDYKTFLKKGYNKKDAIYRAITVYNSSLGHVSNGKKIGDWAKTYDVDYTNKVLNYGSIFDVTDNKKLYKTVTDELLTHPNVFKWRRALEKQKKI